MKNKNTYIDSQNIADISIKLIFRGDVIKTQECTQIRDVVTCLRSWSKMYAMRRWFGQTNIDITCKVDKEIEEEVA